MTQINNGDKVQQRSDLGIHAVGHAENIRQENETTVCDFRFIGGRKIYQVPLASLEKVNE